MKKEIFDFAKRELKYIGLLLLLLIIILKIVYFKENPVIAMRMAFSLFWLFLLPGYFIMLYWKEKLDFVERIIAGSALSAAIIGVSSYYAGLAGLNIKYHAVVLPLALILAGITANFRK